MGVTLERVQNKFACIIGELCNEPYVLSQFAIWVDLRISEYKANGNISLDCTGTSDSPVWLIGLNPPKPVKSEHALHRHPGVAANRVDRLRQPGLTSSQDFSNYPTDRSDFISEESNVTTVKEEPEDVQDIFPVSLHRHDGMASSKFCNTTSRKRLTSDIQNTENSMSRNKLQKMPGKIHIDSFITKVSTQENQSLMSVIGAGDHDLEVVDIDSENQPSANSAIDYEISRIPSLGDNSADETFNISSFSLTQADIKSPIVDWKDSDVYRRASSVANGNKTLGAQELKGGTLSNTRIAAARFRLWLTQNTTEERPFEEIPPAELDDYLVPFYTTVTQLGGKDYSKRSLQSLRERIERHLRIHDYPESILRSPQFVASQNAFKQRCVVLEKASKG